MSLLQEFKRLSLNSLQTKAQIIDNLVHNIKGLSILNFNCQSIKCHKNDLTDTVIRNTNVLLLTET